jgi:hypothetical protein
MRGHRSLVMLCWFVPMTFIGTILIAMQEILLKAVGILLLSCAILLFLSDLYDNFKRR